MLIVFFFFFCNLTLKNLRVGPANNNNILEEILVRVLAETIVARAHTSTDSSRVCKKEKADEVSERICNIEGRERKKKRKREG